MLDKTITSALLALRAQIIRGKLDGLDHVEALLLAGGAALPVLRPSPANRLRSGAIKLFILSSLRNGPQRPCDVARAFHAQQPALTYQVARHRLYKSSDKMAAKGVVVKEGGAWRLAKPVSVPNSRLNKP